MALATSSDEDIASAIKRRRDAAAQSWCLTDEVVLIAAGLPIPVPGRGDRTYPFRAHSEYLYLTDRERAGGVLAFDAHDGWFDFVQPVTREEELWAGAIADRGEGIPTDQLPNWLETRDRRPMAWLGASTDEPQQNTRLQADLRYALNAVRRCKDDVELGRMRLAEAATRAGFDQIASDLSVGRTERELRAKLECTFYLNGADDLAFDTIVASGPHSAVLHHSPTARRLVDGDLVLVDAGAEFRGYASDITRTYPAAKRFTAEQRTIFDIVLEARTVAIKACIPGVEWADIHRMASAVIAQGLLDFGLLRGSVDGVLEQNAQALFFPHGIGHLVGLGIRDAGEVLRGREPAPHAFPRLRFDMPLTAGYVVTVEPGVYIVPALLREPPLPALRRESVNWSLAEQLVDFGGIRIEDNVLITEDNPEILTANVPVQAENNAR